MDEIEQIASKVLGKTSDGKTMMRYETPDEVDKTLLVGIPRHLNRTQYDLTGESLSVLILGTHMSLVAYLIMGFLSLVGYVGHILLIQKTLLNRSLLNYILTHLIWLRWDLQFLSQE